MKKTATLFLLLLLAVFSRAQEILPSRYHFDKAEDYKQYEANVIRGINWLASTPRTESKETRGLIEDFLVLWVKGTPDVQVIIEPYTMKLSKTNPDLLLSFIFGYTLYQLEHAEDKNLLNANIAGITHLIDDYIRNKEVFKKDEQIETLISLQKSGKLEDWVKPRLTHTDSGN
ncbi:hypothetical protein [Rubrolithibacter danxiaensis]|uniref:hypothetical protein n=1 Tax=Rubrolithibacter danxiaensis TaxID=3390805 RepID=UPI003BF8B47F